MEATVSEVASGEDVRVDYASIEKSLAELWRGSTKGGDEAVTRAALWNVVAHTASPEHQAQATQTLAQASASIPQRTIIVRASATADTELAAWISANCHLVGGGKQVCSEEISIVAGGEHVQRVPPLVNALLIPDMPVAVWWLGDIPADEEPYIEALLDPADRLIVDSSHFDSARDLDLVRRVGERTTTAPADLNWVRLEEWRVATASIFDPASMRSRLSRIRQVRIGTGVAGTPFFGHGVEALLYAAWLSAQLGHAVDDNGKVEGAAGAIDYRIERRDEPQDVGAVSSVDFQFDDGTSATISRHHERRVLVASAEGYQSAPDSVTRALARGEEELIVRQLKRPEGDRVLLRALPIATRLAKRLT